MTPVDPKDMEDANTKQGEPKPTPVVIMARPELPTMWFDLMRVTRRTGDDGHQTATFSFAQVLPDLDPEQEFGGAEIARLVTTAGHMRKMIDAMCKNANYYPERPPQKEGAS